MTVETLRWRNNQLEMIDQRCLPSVVQYLSYSDAQTVADGIQKMVVRGAPAIGVAAAYGIALEAQKYVLLNGADFHKRMAQAFEVLAASRPTAVNLFWALNRMRDRLSDAAQTETVSLARLLLDEAHAIYHEDIEINKTMGAFGASILEDGMCVLTHCNAGALATAGHGTALGVIRSAVTAGKKITVFADETRPFLQGARLTAWELSEDGIDTTLITDNMSGHFMKSGAIDAVIVGTDRVAANGDVANKIGTYMVAVLAKEHDIPFYVACPLSTIDLSIPSGDDIPIEERSSNEVTGYGDVRWAPKNIQVRNPSFDVTPARLVTALITEKGIVYSPSDNKLKALY
ncbi:MAG: S-methyl-5-thioribose-1-phosphate isomerase [Proteobacteria bacterium]|nr:S-methyl-5-thioribose-1-phosphate isomerase [Pseudomonadota bacterium]MDA0862026.1 S-methyl-5-thioribose-1-phosphate isomerase [Pseudomonadota bacterium]MDA1030066.1 S-methyl-5-thioribose-1-phosphate isomerase [Pseudomonadota bacterium]